MVKIISGKWVTSQTITQEEVTYDIYTAKYAYTDLGVALWIDKDLTIGNALVGGMDDDTINRGFVIHGEMTGDRSGISVSSAGDVNGDGLDDVIVGAQYADLNSKSNTGKSYVVFGKTNGSAINLNDIASASGTAGFVINGEQASDFSGSSVSSAGDVNGDGLDDLIVSTYGNSGIGKAHVVFGKIDSTAINLLDVAQGTGGFVMNGTSLGISVSGAGDVNGDGLADLIVGAWSASKSYVVFGKKGDTAAINLSNIASASGTGGFVINSETTGDKNGRTVSFAGDVNGDGLDDLIIGAYEADGNKGKSYVVFGKTDTGAVDLGTIGSGTGGFVINGENAQDYSGRSASYAGDVNGDGLDDLIVGAYGVNGNTGKSYVVFGKSDTNTVNLSDIAQGTGGFVLNGEKSGDLSGFSVSYAGDVNGDGLDDLIVGADNSTKGVKGKSYVVFGTTDTTVINLGDIAQGTGGFVVDDRSANDDAGSSGSSVSYAGDVNGDGLDDLIIGAYGENNSQGESYVIFGKTDTDAINLSKLSDDSKYRIDFQGTTGNDNLGDNTTTNKNELFVAGTGNDILTG
ncbi:MAG: hypothetical protein FE834_06845, partial [Gammaproteobacteria bacterium]|nr:hypothetical protein [Gammaproteobacteria bacterium]